MCIHVKLSWETAGFGFSLKKMLGSLVISLWFLWLINISSGKIQRTISGALTDVRSFLYQEWLSWKSSVWTRDCFSELQSPSTFPLSPSDTPPQTAPPVMPSHQPCVLQLKDKSTQQIHKLRMSSLHSLHFSYLFYARWRIFFYLQSMEKYSRQWLISTMP